MRWKGSGCRDRVVRGIRLTGRGLRLGGEVRGSRRRLRGMFVCRGMRERGRGRVGILEVTGDVLVVNVDEICTNGNTPGLANLSSTYISVVHRVRAK
jgi:hypothetical protein